MDAKYIVDLRLNMVESGMENHSKKRKGDGDEDEQKEGMCLHIMHFNSGNFCRLQYSN